MDYDIIEQLAERYSETMKKYIPYKQIIGPREFAELENYAEAIRKSAEALLKQNRNLRVGIVGQMNAGKSSFLNAIFFEGRHVLPKSATPMTAALTRMTYAESPKAIVEFYTQEEWDLIEDLAQEFDEMIRDARQQWEEQYSFAPSSASDGTVVAPPLEQLVEMAQIPEEHQAAKQLVESARNLPNLADLLGEKQPIEAVDLEDLKRQLNNYVGVNGKYTPLVKSSQLFLNIESLRGVEVVDTPGLNDPIVSRSLRTHEYLAQCDVVVLLSYSAQFMDSQDLGLLTTSIRKEGIHNVKILGSKVDSALIDVQRQYASLPQAINGLKDKLTRQAESVLSVRMQRDADNPIYEALKKGLPPVFFSAIAFRIARAYLDVGADPKTPCRESRVHPKLDSEEQLILDNLQYAYPGFNFSPENLLDLANITKIQQDLANLQAEKEKILAGRLNKLLEARRDTFVEELQKCYEKTMDHLYQVKNIKIDELNRAHRDLQAQLEAGRANILDVFVEHRFQVEKELKNLALEIKESYLNMKQQAGNLYKDGTETHNYTVSIAKWYNPFSWGRKETRTNHTHYKYIERVDVVERVEAFALDLEKQVSRRLQQLVNQQELKSQLITKVQALYSGTGGNVAVAAQLLRIREVVGEIQLSDELSFDTEPYVNAVTKAVSSDKARGQQATKLRDIYLESLQKIMKDTVDRVDARRKEIAAQLTRVGEIFFDTLSSDLRARVEQLSSEIADREQQIIRYQNVIDLLAFDISTWKKQ